MLRKVKLRLNDQNYFIEFDVSIKNLIEQKGMDINYGARPVRRAVQTYIEDRIAEGILNEEIKKNEKIFICAENDKVFFKNAKDLISSTTKN